jgi:hypothetical protein
LPFFIALSASLIARFCALVSAALRRLASAIPITAPALLTVPYSLPPVGCDGAGGRGALGVGVTV